MICGHLWLADVVGDSVRVAVGQLLCREPGAAVAALAGGLGAAVAGGKAVVLSGAVVALLAVLVPLLEFAKRADLAIGVGFALCELKTF